MIPGDLLRIFATIADEHLADYGASAPPRVLPIVTDELDFRASLLEELALALGGSVVDITSDEFTGPVAGYDRPQLRGEVQAALSYTDVRGETYSVAIDFGAGTVDARLFINGVPDPAVAAGRQQVLALTRALFSARLDDVELVVIRYSETTLDADAARAVWRPLLGLGERPALRLGGARTAVVLAQAREFSVPHHVSPHGGARFVHTAEVQGSRKPRKFTRAIAGHLAVQRTPPLVLFLGAGFSMSSGLPSGNALRNSAIRRLVGLPDLDDGRTSADLAAEFVQWALALPPELGRFRPEGDTRTAAQLAAGLTLEQVSRVDGFYSGEHIPPAVVEFEDLHARRLASHVALGAAVLNLRALVARQPRLVLVTVNFDELLEVHDPDLFDRAVTDSEFEAVTSVLESMVRGENHPEGKVPLLKLHGTISDTSTCVADEETVRLGVSHRKRDALFALMPSAARRAESVPTGGRTRWVYVGASMRDADLNPTVLQTSEFNLGAEEWWVAPTLEPSVRAFHLGCFRSWAITTDLESRVITDVADEFVSGLVAAWP